jgi:N-acetylglucosamine kinase-like BadF-type ATPase
MRWFLGVDGGQSGTEAMIGDESGNVVGVGHGPACRHAGAIEEAVKQAGGGDVTFEAACFGLSGGQSQVEATAKQAVRAELYRFMHDAAVALTGALEGAPGVIVIAGTGSIAYGRNSAGKEARAGGWGYIFGDEGGALDLVRGALRAALRQEEGWGPPTALREMLLEAAEAPDANTLMHRFYTPEYPRERIAAFSKLLDNAAEGGDHVAQDLLKSAAQTLATIAQVVRGRLFGTGETVAVSYAGGVFHSPVLLARFRMLVELEEGNGLEAPRHSPAAGALMEAYRAASLPCTLKNVSETK